MKNADKQLISRSELAVLRCLHEQRAAELDLMTIEVTQIAMTTGIRDSNEVLRALYTLEGKSLVSPEPKGDFTSSQWQITDVGMRAISMI